MQEIMTANIFHKQYVIVKIKKDQIGKILGINRGRERILKCVFCENDV